MKGIIHTIVTNTKGNEPIHARDLGRVTTTIEGLSNGSISVDAFEGQGDTYKRRQDPEITIRFGETFFEGTLQELAKKLSK
jgi:hypothetical protein